MTTRRGFLSQLLTAIAAGLALPRIGSALEAKNDLMIHGGNEPTSIARIARHINERFLWPHELHLTLEQRLDSDTRLLGRVEDIRERQRTLHLHWFWVFRFQEQPSLYAYRQAKYHCVKIREAVQLERRTGYVMEIVCRQSHPLYGRTFYRHMATGRVRWTRPV